MHYVYKFLDAQHNVLYIGITGNLAGRIKSQHFTKNGHLPRECYIETDVVVYSKCASSDDAKIKERYLINTLAPKYNDKLKNGNTFAFVIEDFDWKYIGINKDEILTTPSSSSEERLVNRSPIPNKNIPFSSKYYPATNLNLQLLDCYPGGSTAIGTTGQKPFDHQSLTALSLNNELWLFYSQIDKAVRHSGCQAGWISSLNALVKHKLDVEDCCIVEDSRTIKENVESSGTSSGRPIYPKFTVIIKASSIRKLMDKFIAEELAPETKRLAREGKFRANKRYATRLIDWPSIYFYDLESFVSHLKNNCRWDTVFHRIDTLLKVVNRAIHKQDLSC